MNGHVVKSYSLSKDSESKIAANFKAKEFACKDGSDTFFISPDLVYILQKVRDYFKTPVNINSGYRTDKYNSSIGGAKFSYHKYGMAADITVTGIPPSIVASFIEGIIPDMGGIGLYSSFVHVDVRKTRYRFKVVNAKETAVNKF